MCSTSRRGCPCLGHFYFRDASHGRGCLKRGGTGRLVLLASRCCPHLRIVFNNRSDFQSPVIVSTSRFVTIGNFGTGNGHVAACAMRAVGRLRPAHFPRPPTPGRRRSARRRARVLSPSRNGDRKSVLSRVAKRVGLFRW